MVGAAGDPAATSHLGEHSPHLHQGSMTSVADVAVYTITGKRDANDKNGDALDMASVEGGANGGAKPPDRAPATATADVEKQPLAGEKKEEQLWKTLMQVAVPFFIAGCGTIGAGLVLANVRDWEVFGEIKPIFILIPSLSGLKGNLDMCLASRLSTQANLGNMDSPREVISMVVGNISLVQVQAIVAATVVSLFAIAVTLLEGKDLTLSHAILLISSAVFTATTTCFVLDFVMVMVIFGSHKFKVNPDNVATPLAASIGDIVSNSVLSVTAQYMYEHTKTTSWQPSALLVVYYCFLPAWVLVVWKNKYTKKVLTAGWTPVIAALFISGIGGIVLKQAVDRFNGYELLQPIVNGIGGNLVCVQSSRLATNLHRTAIPGVLPEDVRLVDWPWKTLFFGTVAAKVARMLLVLAVCGHVIFLLTADFIRKGAITVHFTFAIMYVACTLMQVMVLLYLAYIVVHFMWKLKKDPDNAAIPYLTALGDLIGSVFLGLVFIVLSHYGLEYGNDVQ